MRRPRSAMALTLVGAALAAGCGSDESREDADDVEDGLVEKSEPNVTAFNNKYPNVEHKCLFEHGPTGPEAFGVGMRVIVNTEKRMIVIPDPHCPGYTHEQAGEVGIGGNAP